jgi:hypothetical protein
MLEGHTVPTLDDHVARRADPDRETAGSGVGHRRDRLGHARRSTCERRDDRRAESEPLLPGGRKGERGESVGPVGLSAPKIRVAEIGELDHALTMTVEVAREGNRHAESAIGCRGRSSGRGGGHGRTLVP